MRWQNQEESQNVDDRRGKSVSVGGGIGIGAIILALLAFLLGGNPLTVLQQASQQPQTTQTTGASGPYQPKTKEEAALSKVVKVTLKETEDVWNKIFREQLGRNYEEPTMVLFSGRTTSACGQAHSATGPFYCPGDSDLYIDLSFYNEMKNNFKAAGDFAMAYIVAHEVGHHVQHLMEITTKVQQQKRRVSKAEANQLSVRLELQADFLAGVWTHHAEKMSIQETGRGILEEGDIEEALNSAASVGDDRIQKKSRGYVVPDSFTHGTSEQRMRWFMKGLKSGDLNESDTFSIPYSQL